MTSRIAGTRTARPLLRLVIGGAIGIAVLETAGLLAEGLSPSLASIAYVAISAAYLVAGGVIIERRPGNIVGPLVLVLGLLVTGYLVLDGLIRLGGLSPESGVAALLVYEVDGPFFFAVAMVFLAFPDGRLPGERWRWLVIVDAGLATVVTVSSLVRPGSFAYYPWLDNPLGDPASPLLVLWAPSYGLLVCAVVAAVLSLVGRWRRGNVQERAQLKWVALAAAVLAIAMVFYGGTAGPGEYSEAGDLSVGAGLSLFPIAIAIAVLRYRLYEIDRLVSRTLGWAVVTAILVVAFVVVVVGLQAVLGGVTQGDTFAVAVSTLLAVALFQPVRARVQGVVDRRFNRSRIDAERTVAAFGERLREETDLVRLRGSIVATVQAAVHPAGSALWLRQEMDVDA